MTERFEATSNYPTWLRQQLEIVDALRTKIRERFGNSRYADRLVQENQDLRKDIQYYIGLNPDQEAMETWWVQSARSTIDDQVARHQAKVLQQRSRGLLANLFRPGRGPKR